MFDLDWLREARHSHYTYAHWHCGYGRYAFPPGCGGCGCDCDYSWHQGQQGEGQLEPTPSEKPMDDMTPSEPVDEQAAAPAKFRLFGLGLCVLTILIQHTF